MGFENAISQEVDYQLCCYGRSKMQFRGPKETLRGNYVAALGGTETFGRFMKRPYSSQLGQALDMQVVNLGCQNAGVDAFLRDEAVLDICSASHATVMELPGAANMTNQYYSVHPRRNDRFLRATPMLELLYPEVDFTEINFVRHLLSKLASISEDRFQRVVFELKRTWVYQMKQLSGRISSPLVLLWLSDQVVADEAVGKQLGREPLFVDKTMLNEIRPYVEDIVHSVVSQEEKLLGQCELIFPPHDEVAAMQMLGYRAHEKAAQKLSRALIVFLYSQEFSEL